MKNDKIKIKKVKSAEWNGNGFGTSSAVYTIQGTEIEMWNSNPALHDWIAKDKSVTFENVTEVDGEKIEWQSTYTIGRAPTRKKLLELVTDYLEQS